MSIVFENVSFAYDANHAVVDNIDFELEDGTFLGLIGHTGSGKSTITQLMNALLVPTQGRVLVNGLDTADKKLHRQIRTQVGLVFQYPEQQLFANTIAEDVAFGPRNLGLDENEVQRRCHDALERMGLPFDEFAERSPFDLSGGQRRRVALAGILAMEPSVLVLDEPAAGMDPATNKQIKEYLRAFNEEGMTIVLVSHSMEDVAELCSEVLCIEQGRIFLHGTPEQVFSRQNASELRRINLGVPRATKFAAELAQKGLVLSEPVLTVDQLVEQLVHVLD